MFETPKSEWGLTTPHVLVLICGAGAFFIGAYFDVLWYSWGSMLAIAAALSLFQEGQRSKQLKALALSGNWTFLGDSLPKSFPMQRTSSGSAQFIRNALVGEIKGRRVLLFDCRLGRGKARFSRTVVAACGDVSEFGWARFGPDTEAEQVGNWAVVYGANRLLTVEEIELLLSEFQVVSGKRGQLG